MKSWQAVLIVATLLTHCLTATAAEYPEDGWWWDPTASGRGYLIERQRDVMFITAFHYSPTGTPEWLSMQGQYVPSTNSDSIGSFTGEVYQNSDGQCLGCPYVAPTTVISAQGPAQINFSDNQHATLDWSGESVEISRFLFSFGNSLEQLAGSWAVVTIPAGGIPSVQLVEIEIADGVAALTSPEGAVVGAIVLDDGDLTLSVNGLADDLPLLVPETRRFYAGSASGDSNAVIGMRTDDLPLNYVVGGSSGLGLDLSKFYTGALAEAVTTEPCTLNGGTVTTCYRITVAGFPADRTPGPFCPATVSDSAAAGGIWFDGEAVYDIDGQFILDLATIYGDSAWRMYDELGNVLVTETAEEFEGAARPDVDPALQNHCVEGRLEWLENGEPITTTVLIPTTPVAATNSATPRGILGVTLEGVAIAASAPVDAILGAYTIAAFDDCGGHYNPFEGYHMHAATGCSEAGESAAGDPPIFGYAADGYALHSPFVAGAEPADLDQCNGHITDADGYHYHANSAEKNQVVQCLKGQSVAGPGGPPGGG